MRRWGSSRTRISAATGQIWAAYVLRRSQRRLKSSQVPRISALGVTPFDRVFLLANCKVMVRASHLAGSVLLAICLTV